MRKIKGKMGKEKVLLVTGASSELGCELIKRVYERFDLIFAHYYRSIDRLKALPEEIDNVIPLQADFSDEGSTIRFVENLKEQDAIPTHFVHLASEKIDYKKFHQYEYDEYGRHYYTSVISAILILQWLMPKMLKQKKGRIVFVLSSFVTEVSPKYQSPYIVAKYALMGLMKNLSAEYSGSGITVNAVSPDMMNTRFLEKLPSAVIEINAKNSPLGRNLEASEIVPTIEYLLSDLADVVSGQNITVRGG